MEKRVVITGFGVVSPVGIGVPAFWDSLVNGRSGIGPITHFDAAKFDSRIAGEVKDFVPPEFLPYKELKKTPRFVQFTLKAAEEAIKDSGIDSEKLSSPYDIGTVIGCGVGSMETQEREHLVLLEKGPDRMSPFLIPMLITNEAAGAVAIYFKLKGINFCTVTACASGAHAIGEAFWIIKQGRAKAMVCGGTEAAIVPTSVGGFCAIKALCRDRNDQPQRACRPFDRDRSGFIMSEAAGVIILEELEHAKARGAKIYGEMAGYGATCDAYHITAPDPSAQAPAKAMEIAMELAHISPADAKHLYINAHGTSTELNDKMETAAIKIALGSHAKDVRISSTKSMTGHALGAAGAIEFVASALAVKEKVIPPTINYDNPDPDCDLNYTPNKAVKTDIRAALSNSLGFGGHNASLLIKEFK